MVSAPPLAQREFIVNHSTKSNNKLCYKQSCVGVMIGQWVALVLVGQGFKYRSHSLINRAVTLHHTTWRENIYFADQTNALPQKTIAFISVHKKIYGPGVTQKTSTDQYRRKRHI